MQTLWQDLRYGARMLLKNLGFTLIAVITLALGIGANAAIFSVVNAVLLRPLPYDNPERLIKINETKLPQFPEFSVSPGNFLEWKKQNTVFEKLVAWNGAAFHLVGTGDPERLIGLRVSDGFFAMLGAKPQLGRDFLAEEDQPGRNNVVILSHGLWQRRYGGNPEIVNQTIALSGRTFTVVGIMPATFKFGDGEIEIWTPMAFTAQQAQQHGGHYVQATGRLKLGVTLAQARSEMGAIASRLAAQFPDENAGWNVKLTPMLEDIVKTVKPALLVLLSAVAFVLLIACANVANLLLARASARHKEIAIRTSLGAGRWRVVRQLLTESSLLSLVGGIAGLVLSVWGVRLLLALAPEDLPRVKDVSLDARVLAFTAAVTLLTGLFFGIFPALQASKPNLNEILKDAGRGSTDGGRRRLVRSALVVLEVALALVLLVGAGLFIKSFLRLQRVNPGFNPDHALTTSIAIPARKYPDVQQQAAFFKQLIEKVAVLPGVQAAGASHVVPFTGNDYILGFVIEGRPPYPRGEQPSANYYAVSPDYFKAMGIPLLRGRYFTEGDMRDTTRVAIISDAMAKKFFPGEDPIGKRIHITNGPTTFREIVGIVGDVKHYSLDQDTGWQAYEPYTQQPFSFMTLVTRTAGDPAGLTAAIRKEVSNLDKEQPLSNARTLDKLISDSVAQQRFSVLLLGIFASVAMALAAIGIYGVLSYSVTQRTQEIGIRMALGAGRRDVIKLVVWNGMLLTLVGVGIGLGASFALTRLISTLLFGVSPTDRLTFGSIVLILITVALAACLIPARRAAKVDPLVALRYE